jgi:hypothetical protein
MPPVATRGAGVVAVWGGPIRAVGIVGSAGIGAIFVLCQIGSAIPTLMLPLHSRWNPPEPFCWLYQKDGLLLRRFQQFQRHLKSVPIAPGQAGSPRPPWPPIGQVIEGMPVVAAR